MYLRGSEDLKESVTRSFKQVCATYIARVSVRAVARSATCMVNGCKRSDFQLLSSLIL